MRKMAFWGTAPLLVLALAAGCGDDDTTTDGTDSDGGPTPDMGTMMDGSMPGDGGTEPTDAGGEMDGFVPPGCESIACANGTCALEGDTPVCVCDAGWRGDACDENDKPASTDTMLWLDASESTSLLTGGGTVSAWSDLSPSGATFTQNQSAEQPSLGTINGLTALDFDGVDDSISTGGFAGFTGQARYTVFMVMSSTTQDAILTGIGGGQNRLALLDTSGDTGLWAAHAGGVAGTLTGSAFSGVQVYERERVHLVTIQRTPVAMNIWVDGRFRQLMPTASPENIVGALDIVLGHNAASAATEALQGQIGEVIAYPSALNMEQREAVEDYLGAKWLGSAPSHDESSFGNIQVWLDATDTASLNVIADGTTDTWRNLAGEQDFYAPTPNTNPLYVEDGLNGHPVLRFDGDDDNLRNAFDQPWLDASEYTVVAVAVPRSPLSDQTSYIVSANDVAFNIPGMGLGVKNLGEIVDFRHKAPANVAGFGDSLTISGGTAEAPLVAIGTWNDGEMRIETGFGSETRTPTQIEHGPNLRFWIGAHNNTMSNVDNFAGDIAEVLIFTHELSFAERTALRAMLEAKWGLAD